MKRIRLSLLFAVLALLISGGIAPGHAQPVEAEHLSVELIALQQSAQPGAQLDIGLHFRLEDHWHIYWKNPGDSGQPTSVEWQLPDGVEATGFNWPAPERQGLAGLMNYGYSSEVLLPVKLSVPEDFSVEAVEIVGEAKWLVCREECIPGKATLSLTLPVQSVTPEINAGNEPLFVAAFGAAAIIASYSDSARVGPQWVLSTVVFASPATIRYPSSASSMWIWAA